MAVCNTDQRGCERVEVAKAEHGCPRLWVSRSPLSYNITSFKLTLHDTDPLSMKATQLILNQAARFPRTSPTGVSLPHTHLTSHHLVIPILFA
jgi:hypothetical protein